MLNELYEPRDTEDLAWSRPKLTSLSTLLDGLAHGPLPPRVVLMHGPTGNGKLCTLRVLLNQMANTLCDAAPQCSTRSVSSGTTSTRQGAASNASGKAKKSAAMLASLAEAPAASTSAEGKTSKNSRPSPDDVRGHATPARAAQGRAAQKECCIHVFHSCQSSSLMEYCNFLRGITARCRGQPNAAAMDVEAGPENGHAPAEGPSPSSWDGATTSSSTSLRTSLAPGAVYHAYIIKFYGEPANHRLHQYTRAFMAEYEQLVDQARPALYQDADTNSPAGELLLRMRRNLVFFLHTTHDTHSAKMDLGTAFPREVLSSPALDLFHCTPVTELAMQKRLKAVLDKEAVRRWRLGKLQWAPTAVEKKRGCVALPPLSKRKRTSATANGPLRQHCANPLEPTGDMLLSPADIKFVAAASQGDVRQALLQIQWLILLPPGMDTDRKKRAFLCAAPSTARRADATHDTPDLHVDGEVCQDAIVQSILDRITSKNGTLFKRSDADDRGSAGEEEKVNLSHEGSVRVNSDLPENPPSQDNQESSRTQDAADVVSVSSDTSLESVESGSSTSLLFAETGGRVSHDTSPTKPDENSAAGTRRAKKRPRSVLDLVESSLDDSTTDGLDENSGSLPPLYAHVRRGRAQQEGRPHSSSMRAGSTQLHQSPRGARGNAERDAAGASDALEKDKRICGPTVRDEYLGLSHATARLLTQKYELRDVVNVLNVQPRKILAYMLNNLPPYFTPHQMADYEACVAAGSEADALRVMEGGVGLQAGAQFRRNMLDARTSGHGGASNRTAGDDGATGMAEQQQLDLMALATFDLSYRTFHREVFVPRSFVAQRPPPYQKMPYPRVHTVSAAWAAALRRYTSRPTDDSTRSLAEELEVRVAHRVPEEDIEEEFLDRLARSEDTPSSSQGGSSAAGPLCAQRVPRLLGEDSDMLREALPSYQDVCASLESVLLDYAPYAQYIVLDRPLPSSTADAVVSQSQHGPTTRTSFSYRTSPTPQAGATQQTQGSSLMSTAAFTSTASTGPSVGPKRTVFKFTATSNASTTPPAAPSKHEPPHRRPCTELQMKLLQRGLPITVGLRHSEFTLVSGHVAVQVRRALAAGATSKDGADLSPAKGDRFTRPLIPVGDTIEDFSD